MYRKIYVDISYFNQDTKHSSATGQNEEKSQSSYVSYQQP